MGTTLIASARDVATRHLYETVDRLAAHGPVLADQMPSIDILELWPRLAVQLIGTSPELDVKADGSPAEPTGLCAALMEAPKMLAVMAELRAALEDPATTEKTWREFRGNLGYRSDAYMSAFLRRSDSASDLAARRAVVRAGIYAAEAGADIAHTMFQYTRTDGIRAFEHPASNAVTNAATAFAWWMCQGEWHRQMPHEAEYYWKPVRDRETKLFARDVAEMVRRAT